MNKKTTTHGTKPKKQIILKQWLKNNKIYFETLMTIALTIMGICVSIASLFLQKYSVELQREQTSLTEQLNMPSFNIYEEYRAGDFMYPSGTEISIFNNGGNITNGSLSADQRIEIIVMDRAFNKIGEISLINTQRFPKNFSYYDAQNKKFTIIREIVTYIDDDVLEWFLINQLNSNYESCLFSVSITEYVNIRYKDFQGNIHNDWNKLENSKLFACEPIDTENCICLKFSSISNDDIYNVIAEYIDEIIDL